MKKDILADDWQGIVMGETPVDKLASGQGWHQSVLLAVEPQHPVVSQNALQGCHVMAKFFEDIAFDTLSGCSEFL
jgi:hypothetical protein